MWEDEKVMTSASPMCKAICDAGMVAEVAVYGERNCVADNVDHRDILVTSFENAGLDYRVRPWGMHGGF